MSQNPEGSQQDPVDQSEKKTVSYDSFQKLLGEKKKTQQAMEELNQRLEQYEQEKLEAEGKLKESNENLKALLAKSKLREKELAQTVQSKVIRRQFLSEAEKLGCLDADLAFQALDLSDIDVNDEFELDQAKLTEKLTDLTKNKSYLFKKEVQTPNHVTPSNGGGAVNLSDLSDAELKSLLSKAK